MSVDSSSQPAASPKTSSLLPWLQLIRIPNLPTAIADVLAGYLISRPPPLHVEYGYLIAAMGISACLYCAGMAVNDYYDIGTDRKERPSRPIPSGRIRRRDAAGLGVWLITMGLSLGFLLGAACALTAIFLTACIFAYNAGFKKSAIGPVFMGLCRFLNLMIGVFAARASFLDITFFAFGDVATLTLPLLAALGNGIYITGVTYFARKEVSVSSSAALVYSSAIMLAGISLHVWLERKTEHDPALFWSAFALWLFYLSTVVLLAIRDPLPRNVQRVIKTAIFGLVIFDAFLVWSFVGAGLALLVLALLLPSVVLGRYVYST